MSESRRVALLDLPWLLLESRPHPMHIAGVLICRYPPGAPAGYLSGLVTAMRRCGTAEAPFDRRVSSMLPIPRWETIGDLDLDYHLKQSTLPAPGGDEQLHGQVAHLHEQPLDMSKPPWQVYLIDGLEDRRFAVYAKFHHALTDGLGAIRFLQAALTTDPNDDGPPPLWAGARHSGPTDPVEASRSDRVGVRSLGRVRTLSRALTAVGKAQLHGPRARPYAAPRSVLNGAVGRRRQIATVDAELTRLRDLAAAIDGTVNDALLAVCATALRSYLLAHSTLPVRPLIASVPVSIRPAGDAPDSGHVRNRGAGNPGAGNVLSFAFTTLATTQPDHRRRTRTVMASIHDAKQYLHAVPREVLDPYTVATMAPFIGTQLLGLGALAPPMFNLVISNFTGPTHPGYYGNALVEAIYPVSILQTGQALNITALSYADRLHITLTGSPESLPHLPGLATHWDSSLHELETEYGTRREPPVATGPVHNHDPPDASTTSPTATHPTRTTK